MHHKHCYQNLCYVMTLTRSNEIPAPSMPFLGPRTISATHFFEQLDCHIPMATIHMIRSQPVICTSSLSSQ